MQHVFCGNWVGLCRDDKFVVLQIISGSKIDLTSKQLIKLFQINVTKILVELNLVQADFRDEALNLNAEKLLAQQKT